MPEIAYGNIPRYGAVKTHITACGEIKTTPNNHPSHVGWDTSTEVCDTSPVDLENSYWINMESVCPETGNSSLLASMSGMLQSRELHGDKESSSFPPAHNVLSPSPPLPLEYYIGSLLFNIFINDSTDHFHSNTIVKLFADDIKLYTFYTNISQKNLQHEINTIL